MAVITAGDLRHKVTLLQPSVSSNDEGGKVLSHSPAFVTFAAIKNGNTDRVTEGSGAGVVYQKKFIVRWTAGREAITKDWLIRYQNENYTIQSIAQMDEDKQFIELKGSIKNNG